MSIIYRYLASYTLTTIKLVHPQFMDPSSFGKWSDHEPFILK